MGGGGPGFRFLDLARLTEPLGAGDHDREVDLRSDPLVVVFQEGVHRAAVQAELAGSGQEGELEDLGHLGRDLTGVGVYRVAPAEH